MRFFSMTCAQQCLWLAISHPMDSPSLPIKISTKIPAASLLSPSFLPLDPLTHHSHEFQRASFWCCTWKKKFRYINGVDVFMSQNPLTFSMKFFQNSTLLQLTFLLAQCLLNCDPIRGRHHCHWHLVGHRLVMLDGALGALRHLMLTQLFLWLREKGPRIPEFCLVHTACGIPMSSRSELTKNQEKKPG